MKKLIVLPVIAVFIIGCSGGEKESHQKETSLEQNRPRVVMETDFGTIVLELFPDVAPNHVKNFLNLVNDGFYDGLVFHRVDKGFVIQGGSPDGSLAGHAGFTIPAEFSNVQHLPGTLGMARGSDPNTGSCQFYICLAQLPDLDGKYTVFGQTVEGMNVVNKIGEVPTDKETERPLEPVYMARVWEEGKGEPGGSE
jgi:peptidyl-prolyl cis-trans isomerase B (cyclophilin B)